MTTPQSAKTNIFYTPYIGNLVPIFSGSLLLATPFAELTNITTDSSTGNAGPAAVGANSNYDLFVWNNAGTVTLTRGPAWISNVSRGTGAGTTELQRAGGILTNAVAITNGPGANHGSYVGTVRSDDSMQINFLFGGTSNNGTAAMLHVWNAYNRVDVRGFVGDSTSNWSYSSATWRQSNGSMGNQVNFISGQEEDIISFTATSLSTGDAGTNTALVGVGFDSTSAPASGSMRTAGSSYANGATYANPIASFSPPPALGHHYGAILEFADTTGTMTWFGNPGGNRPTQPGLSYSWRY